MSLETTQTDRIEVVSRGVGGELEKVCLVGVSSVKRTREAIRRVPDCYVAILALQAYPRGSKSRALLWIAKASGKSRRHGRQTLNFAGADLDQESHARYQNGSFFGHRRFPWSESAGAEPFEVLSWALGDAVAVRLGRDPVHLFAAT